jgi:hypothetical protein
MPPMFAEGINSEAEPLEMRDLSGKPKAYRKGCGQAAFDLN